jgi:hypothetical protein
MRTPPVGWGGVEVTFEVQKSVPLCAKPISTEA